MSKVAELLAQLTPGSGGQRLNPMEAAPLLASMIIAAQKEQRAAPFIDTLKQFGQQWTAATPAQQPQINAGANKVRADYLAKGGSPVDVPAEYWGSDPSQGFQTGTGKFAPGYAGDNMSMGQKERLSTVTGEYEGQPTWPAQVQQQTLENQRYGSQLGYGASMAGTNEQIRQHDIENRQMTATNTYINQVMGASTPEAAFKYLNEFGTQIATEGADMKSILYAMAMKWPEYFAKYSGSLNPAGQTNPYSTLAPQQGTPSK